VRPGRFVRPFALPSHTAVALCLVAAALTGALWNTDASLRPLFNFGRMLDQRTIWYVVAPIASLLLLMSIVGLIQWVIDMRGEQAPA